MTVLVGEHRVAEPCMAQGMAQQRQLAVIEPIRTLQAPLQHGHLIGLALQIGVPIGDRLLDRPCLSIDQ